MRAGIIRGLIAPVALLALWTFSGCGDFFVDEPHGGGGGTSSGNYVYVANASTQTIAAYSISSGKLTSVPGSPFSLQYSPRALAVTPSNSFLYVAGTGAIYAYTINSDGSLSASSQGAGVAAVNVASMDISPDGQWLFGLDLTQRQLDEFQINSSTGALSAIAATQYSVADTNAVVVPTMVRVAPTGNYVFAALGTGGDIVFTLNTATGAIATSQQQLSTGSAQTSDNAIAIDSTTLHLYIARSGSNGGLAVFNIGAAGALSQISGSPFTTGGGPSAVQIDRSGKYVYAANRGDGTITGFAIGSTGALTALAGSPYASGTQVNSLAADKTSTYILAGALGGSPDLSMYSIDTANPGKLILATSTATGTDPTGVAEIAVTH
jgi:6-phosphogluconolactonase